MDWCFDNRPYDLILPGLCMPDFESSHIGLIISWADNCIAIEVANQKLGPSPACKPKLQQAGIYYLVNEEKIMSQMVFQSMTFSVPIYESLRYSRTGWDDAF